MIIIDGPPVHTITTLKKIAEEVVVEKLEYNSTLPP